MDKKRLNELKIKMVDLPPDPETGQIESEVMYLPDFETIYYGLEKALTEFKSLLTHNSIEPTMRVKIDNDLRLNSLFKNLTSTFNQYRSHLKDNYPREYEDILKARQFHIKS